MKISSVKIISLLFFVLSAFYLYTAYQIQVFSFDENAPFNAKTFPIYLGYAGMFLAGLKIILPERLKEEVDHKVLDYKKVIFLVIIMIFYGLTILRVGFFYLHQFFYSYLIIFWREKMEIYDNFLIPICCYFYVFITRTLNIYLRDPFLKYLGIIG